MAEPLLVQLSELAARDDIEGFEAWLEGFHDDIESINYTQKRGVLLRFGVEVKVHRGEQGAYFTWTVRLSRQANELAAIFNELAEEFDPNRLVEGGFDPFNPRAKVIDLSRSTGNLGRPAARRAG